MVADISKYTGREQAWVKHFFLAGYLESFVHKTASKYDHIAYVDGFSGPWQSGGENYEDTSFGIALAALRTAKARWKALGRDVHMSAHLVEKRRDAYLSLEAYKAKFPDIEIHTYNDDFMKVMPRVLAAIPAPAFAFFLLDPKGWRFDAQELAPLLSRPNAEVVFNFMFDFINRTASMSDPALVAGLNALMPYGDWRDKLNALSAQQSPDASRQRKAILIDAFRQTLATIGHYDYVAEVPVLRPLKDRMLYALVYATRHATGIEVFRDWHVKTEHAQAQVRTAAKHADKVAKTKQPDFFEGVQTGPSEIEAFLAEERQAAREALIAMVPPSPQTVLYKDVWPTILARHAVRRTDMNQMAGELRKADLLHFPDWQPGKRVPADTYRISKAAKPID